jgi:hypothetical protein
MVSNRLVPVFTVQLSRAVNFPRPSCFPSDPVGGGLAPVAMIDPAVCLGVISMSATTTGLRLGQPARNASAQSLYGQAMRLVYERLGNSSTTDETIMAAITLLVVSVLFGNEAAIKQNRRVVRDLVARRGGPSQLGMGGVLADYLIFGEVFGALWLKDEPFYVSEATPGFLMTPPPVVYGAGFSSPPILESLHPNMIEICFTMCRLTEVLEKATREGATPQEFIYFYSTLKWVSVRRMNYGLGATILGPRMNASVMLSKFFDAMCSEHNRRAEASISTSVPNYSTHSCEPTYFCTGTDRLKFSSGHYSLWEP